jgi:hypothetical protein
MQHEDIDWIRQLSSLRERDELMLTLERIK